MLYFKSNDDSLSTNWLSNIENASKIDSIINVIICLSISRIP